MCVYPLATGLLLLAAQRHAVSERPRESPPSATIDAVALRADAAAVRQRGNGGSISDTRAKQQGAFASFVELGGRRHQEALESKLMEHAQNRKGRAPGAPSELSYPQYTHYGQHLAQSIDDLHAKVTSGVDQLAHDADMKSRKYGYGLDGLRWEVDNLKTSVTNYRNRLKSNLMNQTSEMMKAMANGQTWDEHAFLRPIPEGLWYNGLIDTLTQEPAPGLDGVKKRPRYKLGKRDPDEPVPSQYVHPETSAIYKMAYEHGYENASMGKPHGFNIDAEILNEEPVAYTWTKGGIQWADSHIFLGTAKEMAPKEEGGWLTKQQIAELQKVYGPNTDLDHAVQEGILERYDVNGVLPYTWTATGHLWAMENKVFKGPPPSARSFVNREQLQAVGAFRHVQDQTPEELIKIGLLATSPQAEKKLAAYKAGKRRNKERSYDKRQLDKNGLPVGFERFLDQKFIRTHNGETPRPGGSEGVVLDGSGQSEPEVQSETTAKKQAKLRQAGLIAPLPKMEREKTANPNEEMTPMMPTLPRERSASAQPATETVNAEKREATVEDMLPASLKPKAPKLKSKL